jgi:hypothetical protein
MLTHSYAKRSRVAIEKEHRQNKPPPSRQSLRSRGKDVEEEEEEDMNRLDEDDFALGSGGDDDDLSTMMSDATDAETGGELGSSLSDEDDDAASDISGQASDDERDSSDLERTYETRRRREEVPEQSTSASKTLMPIKLSNGKLARHPDDIDTSSNRPTKEKNRVVFSPSPEPSDDEGHASQRLVGTY